MKTAIFSAHAYDKNFLKAANTNYGFQLQFYEQVLTEKTVSLAKNFDAICAFVHDELRTPVLEQLAQFGVKLITMRCAGFDNVDIAAAEKRGITVARVPAYSPYAVAEHALGLILALNRKLHRAYHRVRESNFSLDGLLGFDLQGKTVGIIGTGRIGAVLVKILLGLGCKVLAHDIQQNPICIELGATYVDLETLYKESDIVSLHCPLTADTHHLIDDTSIQQMKPGVMIINTSRGAVVDTSAAIRGLKSGQVGSLGLDVYEGEQHLFFQDLSETIIQDDMFERLITFPNVLVTAHQGFFTRDALMSIAETTLRNIEGYPADIPQQNLLTKEHCI